MQWLNSTNPTIYINEATLMIESVLVEDTGSNNSKLTVTSDNKVRIKVGSYINSDYDELILTVRLRNLAQVIIASGLNTVTLRGSVSVKMPDSIQMSCGNKNKDKRFCKLFEL